MFHVCFGPIWLKSSPCYEMCEQVYFRNVFFSSSKKHIRDCTCLKQHAFWVDTLGTFWFSYFQDSMFFLAQKRKTIPWKKGPTWGAHSSNWAPKIPKSPIPIQKVSPKDAHSEFWRLRASRPPCESTFTIRVSGSSLFLTRPTLYCVCDHEDFTNLEVACFFHYFLRTLRTSWCSFSSLFGNNSAINVSFFGDWRTKFNSDWISERLLCVSSSVNRSGSPCNRRSIQEILCFITVITQRVSPCCFHTWLHKVWVRYA